MSHVTIVTTSKYYGTDNSSCRGNSSSSSNCSSNKNNNDTTNNNDECDSGSTWELRPAHQSELQPLPSENHVICGINIAQLETLDTVHLLQSTLWRVYSAAWRGAATLPPPPPPFPPSKPLNSLLTVNGKIRSREELVFKYFVNVVSFSTSKKEIYISLKRFQNRHSSLVMFQLTGQMAEGGRQNFLTHGR